MLNGNRVDAVEGQVYITKGYEEFQIVGPDAPRQKTTSTYHF